MRMISLPRLLSTTLLAGARALSAKPASAGALLRDVATPALCVDMDVFERNCETLKAMLADTGVKARPHAKAHKSGYLARAQLAILGDVASGVCCQTVRELEAMVAAGVDDIFLTNQVAALEQAVAGSSKTLDVYVEVDVGQNRCGTRPGAPAADLAATVVAADGLRFRGAHCYHGLLQHVRKTDERKAKVGGVCDGVRATLAALEAAGIGCDVPGSFCLMDGDYLANDYDDAPFERSLAVVDAGSKAVDLVSGAPTLAVGSFRSGGDEHGIIDGPGDLACGDHVELFPSHCDPCVNLHDYWVCHRGGVVEAVVPVDARGPGL
ncbi:serine dehydratase [Aureococcus anophagefferens]|nr:serine dehydratase [Aureococcus anophagefferens]